jgi:outer membrane protein OmpA-like peptidoglycan-associated protein
MVITGKQKIFAAVLSGLIITYALTGFYLVPYLVKTKLPEILAEKTKCSAAIQAVRFNPFRFEFEMDGFSITESNGKNLAGFDSLLVNFNAFASLSQQTILFDNIILRKPDANIIRLANGSLNFSDLKAKDNHPAQEENKPASPPPPIFIKHLAIEEGHMTWQDESGGHSKTESLLPVNFSIDNFTTQINHTGEYNLNLEIASGGHLQLQGDVSLSPITSKGRLSLENLGLTQIWQLFLQDILPVEITDGRLKVQTEYQLSLADGRFELVTNQGELDLNQFAIAEKGQTEPLLSIPVFAIHEITSDLDKHLLTMQTLASHDAVIKASLQADGQLNYQRIFSKKPGNSVQPTPPAGAPAPSPQPEASSTPAWQISLSELDLTNYQLQFIDRSKKKPQTFQLSSLNFDLQKFGNAKGEKLPVKFSTTYNQKGKFAANGDLNLSPFSTNLAIDIKNIQLKNFQDYLDEYLKLQVVDGEFNGHGNLQLATADKLQLNFQGDADIADLITRDKINNKDFLKWSDLQLQQINVDLANQNYSLGKVLFDKPYIRVSIQKDRSNNINELIVKQTTQNKAEAKPAVKSDKSDKSVAEPKINIGKIQIQNGDSDFSDYSLILPFLANMGSLDGQIEGFSSNQDSPIKLALQGKVYNLAKVNINGNYQINNGDSNIVLKFEHMPLPLITPYMADFAGYKIEKGQMSLDLQYKISKGQLEAKNKIFIDQLVLGDKVENPHASSLPLHLAIALLKDSDGKINLDFPITGSLNDPQFSVGALIVDVLENLISKLVTSPFKALGSLLSEDKNYSAIVFSAGSAELQPQEMSKLDELAKAMQNKPDLTLDIKGITYQVSDWPAMRNDALVEILKKMKSGELRDKGENIRSEYIQLSDDEYKRLLTKFFKEVFPQDIDVSILGKPHIKSQPDADFYDVARQKLEAQMQPDPQRLNDLAISREKSISKYLNEKAGLDISRLYLLAPELKTTEGDEISSVLSLNVAQ